MRYRTGCTLIVLCLLLSATLSPVEAQNDNRPSVTLQRVPCGTPPKSGPITEGECAAFKIRLSVTAPASLEVRFQLSDSDDFGLSVSGARQGVGENVTNFYVTIAEMETESGIITVRTDDDREDEDNGFFTISLPAKATEPNLYKRGSPGTFSVTVNDNDDPTAPAAPSNLSASSGDAQVVLTWNDPSNSAITGYDLRQRISGGSWGSWTQISSSASTTSHTVTGLTNSQTYEFEVRAVAGTVLGAVSTVSATPTAPSPTAPAAPSNLSASSGDAQVVLTWNDPSNSAITRYDLRQRISGGSWGSWTQISSSASTTSHTVTGLTNSQTYEFEVRAVAGTVLGAVSTVSATPTAPSPTAPAAPSNLSASSGDAQVVLTWNDPSNSAITRYDLRQRISGGSWGSWTQISSSASTTSHTVTGLTNSQTYEFEVRAVAGTVLGAVSAVSATPTAPSTPPTTPETPTTPPPTIPETPTTPPPPSAALIFEPDALTVVEGDSGTYTVALATQPTGIVTVTVTGVSDEVTIDTDGLTDGDQNTLTFNSSNWSTAQTVTVTAGEDDDNSDDSTTLNHSASGGDYGSVTGDVAVTVTDNDTPGLVLNPTVLTIDEGGSGTYTVALATQPTGIVTVTVTGVSDEVTIDTDGLTDGDQNTLTFNSSNWSTAQTVTVTAGEDDDNSDDSTTLNHSASGGDYGSVTGDVAVTVTDNDTPGLVLNPTVLTIDEGGSGTYTVALATQPTGIVTVTVTGVSDEVTIDTDGVADGDQNTLTFNSSNWSTAQTVTVTAGEDDDNSDDSTTLNHSASGGDYGSVTGDVAVTVTDNDDQPQPRETPSVIVTAASAGPLAEGELLTFRLTVNPVPLTNLRVNYIVADAKGADFIAPANEGAQMIVIPAGQSTQNLTVATVADSTDEPSGLVSVTVVTGTNYRLGATISSEVEVVDDDLPSMIDDNASALASAYLVRFGRTLAEQTLDGIAVRTAAERTPGFRGALAGQPLTFNSAVPVRAIDPFDSSASPSLILTAQEALLGSRFALTGQPDAAGGTMAFWGRASQNRFDGTERGGGESVLLDGKVTTSLLGADYAQGDWLVGVALTQSKSEGDYFGVGSSTCPQVADRVPMRCDGGIEASLRAAVPYGVWQISEQLEFWGALGKGKGDVTLRSTHRSYRADIDWYMAATGVRGSVLTPSADGSVPAVTIIADALRAKTTSNRGLDLAATNVKVTRLRLGLESRWHLTFDGDSHLTPSLAAGARRDGGDAETGLGFEFGGGITWSHPRLGLSLDLSGRTLIAHEDETFEDRGLSAAFTFDPDPTTQRGPSFSLRHDAGAQFQGGLDALFAPDPMQERAGGSQAESRLTVGAAWGWPIADGRFIGSPYADVGLGTKTRVTTLGWRLAREVTSAPDLYLDLKLTHEADATQVPEQTVGVKATVRW